eukprot:CAMPEP_0185775072 /NCGR_PEP_ID=MMETSP1174-20130828/81139_1 /TAXON_ID=35687 /ORGANISM="Dictyocha speculum, Strain CCMP1381" /LENGTH=366 /DNA_ID=CAMNT_0028462541 /DNA_START=369 /DNA_END=1469 /DNA_ORIENTATION=+
MVASAANKETHFVSASLRSAIEITQALLTGYTPVDIIGADSDVQRQWQQAATRQRQFLDTAMAYALISLDRRLCIHPRQAGPDALALLEHMLLDDNEDFLDPALRLALKAAETDGGVRLRALCREECGPGMVFSLPMFTPSCCEMLLREVENFESCGLPVHRPNSMNNYGLILTEIGMGPLMTALQRVVTQPIAKLLFPDEGEWLDGHHSFTVRYKCGEDLGLDMHTDDSDVTFNTCLGKPGFTGAGLTFCGMMGSSDHRHFKQRYIHSIGRCVVHLGRQRHGADDIGEGTRVNLIMWNKSTAFRRKMQLRPQAYEREGRLPSMECLSFTHDRDYYMYKQKPVRRQGAGAGWCPPRGKEFQESTLH